MFQNSFRFYLFWLSVLLCLKCIFSQDMCNGIDEEHSEGTQCHTGRVREYCHHRFGVGTVVKYRCFQRYKPRKGGDASTNLPTNSSADPNAWNSVTCLSNNVWSSPHFMNFSCEREPYEYCGPGYAKFFNFYDSIRITVIIVLCSIGCLTNAINLIVFTRPKMRNPLNMVLATLAFTDLLFMVAGLVEHGRLVYRRQYGDSRTSYQEMVDFFVDQILYYLFHTWSIYLTLLVAFMRFYGVLKPLHSRRFLTIANVRWAILVTILFSGALLPMMYWGARVERVEIDDPETSTNSTIDPEYRWSLSALAQQFLFWIYAIMVKLVPCTVLSILIVGLIWCLITATSDRSKLRGNAEEGKAKQNTAPSGGGDAKGNSEYNRTTWMLVTLLIFFVLTESPDAIVSILFVSLPTVSSLSDECLRPTSNFIKLLEFMSSLSSFVFYVSMSLAYRTTLREIVGAGFVERLARLGGRQVLSRQGRDRQGRNIDH